MKGIAIIGTGNISGAHVNAYLSFGERCRIVALCDIVEEKAVRLKEKFQLDCDVVDDHRKLLNRPDIDLVSVCTPPFTHADIAVDFLEAGKHTLVEKPMSSSLEECDRMIEAAGRSGKILSVIGQNRFRDPIMKLKQTLDSGLAGRVLHAQVDSHWWRGHCYYDLWWRGTWEKEGGGCTLNHAVHHIDMLQWMLGMPEKVHAVMSNTAHDNAEVEDLSVAILRYPNGGLAQITSSVVHHGEEQQLIFQCEKARLSAPWKVYASSSKPNGFPERNETLEAKLDAFMAGLPDLPHSGHAGQVDNVLAAIESGGGVLIDGEQGKRTLELIMAVYQSAATGQAVELPLKPEDPFYTRAGIQQHAPHFYEKTQALVDFEQSEITLGSDYKSK